MFSEDDLLPLSGLQHLVFCERQWALIHLEQQWVENRLTAEGRLMHEHAHEQKEEWREGVRVSRGLAVRSLLLGLGRHCGRGGVPPTGPQGPPRPFPIEYKRGRPKPDRWDEVQLCAQALVPGGNGRRGRHCPWARSFTASLAAAPRSTSTAICGQRPKLQVTDECTPSMQPAPRHQPSTRSEKCDRCSGLLEICLPATDERGTVGRGILEKRRVRGDKERGEQLMRHLLNTLYVTTQGSYLAREAEVVVINPEDGKARLPSLPIHTLGGVVCFGQVSCSPPLLGLCAERDVAVSFLTEHGKFLARVVRIPHTETFCCGAPNIALPITKGAARQRSLGRWSSAK